MSLRGNVVLDKGSGCSCRALRSFLLELAGPPGCVSNDCLWFERLHPGTVLQISGISPFERSVGCHTIRAGTFQCSPVVVGDTCEVENTIQCLNATPPLHPMTTAFGCIGAGSNEWARDLCPTGLVLTSVKSGAKATAASTVRGSALLLMIPSIPS